MTWMRAGVILIVAILMTAFGHTFAHQGLPHMQFGEHWYLYVIETMMYWCCWAALLIWHTNHCERLEMEMKADLGEYYEKRNL